MSGWKSLDQAGGVEPAAARRLTVALSDAAGGQGGGGWGRMKAAFPVYQTQVKFS